MRYVFLLLILCLAFVALNSVTKYSRPLSFLSTGSAAPASGNVYSAHRHASAAVSTETTNSEITGTVPSKGGPSEGFGLRTASAAGGVKAQENASDAGAIGTVASAEIAPAPIASPKTLVNKSAGAAAPRVASTGFNRPVALAAAKGSVSTSGSAMRSAAGSATAPVSTYVSATKSSIASTPVAARKSDATTTSIASSAANTVAMATNKSTSTANPAASDHTIADAKADGNEQAAAVAATESASSTMNLGSALALDADFLELAPLPDAVQVQPAATPFALSALSEAYALHIMDSIRNSLMDPHGIQFGGIAGLNWSGASATNTGGKVSGTPLMGFNLGFFADVPVAKKVSIRPEILYSFEGYQPNVNGEKINVHVAYLNMPIDLVYHTNWFNKRIYIGAGPYAAYGLSGTYTMKGIDTDMQFGNNYTNGDNLRKVDLGANFMAGVLLDRNFIIGAKFDLGLSNIAPAGAASQIHTRSFGLSIGYVFRNRANTKTL